MSMSYHHAPLAVSPHYRLLTLLDPLRNVLWNMIHHHGQEVEAQIASPFPAHQNPIPTMSQTRISTIWISIGQHFSSEGRTHNGSHGMCSGSGPSDKSWLNSYPNVKLSLVRRRIGATAQGNWWTCFFFRSHNFHASQQHLQQPSVAMLHVFYLSETQKLEIFSDREAFSLV